MRRPSIEVTHPSKRAGRLITVGCRYRIVSVTVGPAAPAITLAAVRTRSNAPANTAPWTHPGAPSYVEVNVAFPMALGGSNSITSGSATGLHGPITTSKGMTSAKLLVASAPALSAAYRLAPTPSDSGRWRSSWSATPDNVAVASAKVSHEATELTVAAIRRRTAVAKAWRPLSLDGPIGIDAGSSDDVGVLIDRTAPRSRREHRAPSACHRPGRKEPVAPPRTRPILHSGPTSHRWAPSRMEPPGSTPGHGPVLRTPSGVRAAPRPTLTLRSASSHRRTRRWPRRPRGTDRHPPRSSPAVVVSVWASSNTDRGTRRCRGTGPAPLTTTPACTGRAHVRPLSSRRTPHRDRLPLRDSNRIRARISPGPRSDGRGWRASFPTRSDRAGQPGPRRCPD